TEEPHGPRHEIKLRNGARISEAARHLRRAVAQKVHRRQGHRLLIAVQADVIQAPEPEERAHADDYGERHERSCVHPHIGAGRLKERGHVREPRGRSLAQACPRRAALAEYLFGYGNLSAHSRLTAAASPSASARLPAAARSITSCHQYAFSPRRSTIAVSS